MTWKSNFKNYELIKFISATEDIKGADCVDCVSITIL